MHINDILDLPNLQEIKARFDTMYAKAGADDCWVWQRAQSHNGYGLFTAKHHHQVRAHRFAYVLAKGAIPREPAFKGDRHHTLQIRHRCHNPLCVNPKHLIPGTAKENTQDKIDAARKYGAGEDNYAAKLTAVQVAAIRQDPRRQIDIAADYGVERSAISRILRGSGWRSVRTETIDRPRHKTGGVGTANGRAKLTVEQVRAIRADPRPNKVVAEEYGVHKENVYSIRARLTWKHVA